MLPRVAAELERVSNPPTSMETLPAVPKEVSIVPSAFSRVTPKLVPAFPRISSLPSDCLATRQPSSLVFPNGMMLKPPPHALENWGASLTAVMLVPSATVAEE